MDKGCTLTVTETERAVTLSTGMTNYRYLGVMEPNHTCNEPKPLKSGDVVIVQNLAANKDVLVKGPCGCKFLLYEADVLELTREEIIARIEEGARRRLGMSAGDLVRKYRRGQLDEPGAVADLLALANLLPDTDPLFADAA